VFFGFVLFDGMVVYGFLAWNFFIFPSSARLAAHILEQIYEAIFSDHSH